MGHIRRGTFIRGLLCKMHDSCRLETTPLLWLFSESENNSAFRKMTALVGACCFRYLWGDKIWSRRSNFNNRSTRFKARQVAECCTSSRNTTRQRFTTVKLSAWQIFQRCRNTDFGLQSNVAGMCTYVYVEPGWACCVNKVASDQEIFQRSSDTWQKAEAVQSSPHTISCPTCSCYHVVLCLGLLIVQFWQHCLARAL